MTLDEYQQLAMRSDGVEASFVPTPKQMLLLYCAVAIAGEAGELADYIKKVVFHGKPLDEALLLKEGGDVAWGLAKLCKTLNTTMNALGEMNIDKLKKRYPDGFSVAAAEARIDTLTTAGMKPDLEKP